MSAKMTLTTAASASTFIGTIGVNGEADATTASELLYLGVDHLRADATSAARLLAAGADGAKIDVIVPWYMRAITSTDLSDLLTGFNPAASVIEAIEGPNEVNNDPDSFGGLTGAAGVEAEQKKIYALVKSDATLNNADKNTAVYDFTVLQGTAANAYGGMSAYADYNNVHAYGGAGIPPWWILPGVTKNSTIAGAKAEIVTETGATTIAGPGGVDPATQARYDLDALLDDFKLGVSRTYLYDIQDWVTGSSVDNFSAYYGLYNTNGTIKLAGTALHNFTAILSQGNSTNPSSSTAQALSYGISGLPYYGKVQLLSKSGGVFDFALWNETADWNVTKRSEVVIPTDTVMITLASTFKTISIYDPLLSANPIKTVKNASSITFSISSDPLIVEVTPEPPTITLSALGTKQEAIPGVGVTVTETVSTSNLAGSIYVGVLTASGAVEKAFSPVTLNSRGAAAFSITLAHSGDYIVAESSLARPIVTAKSTAISITEQAATSLETKESTAETPMFIASDSKPGLSTGTSLKEAVDGLADQHSTILSGFSTTGTGSGGSSYPVLPSHTAAGGHMLAIVPNQPDLISVPTS